MKKLVMIFPVFLVITGCAQDPFSTGLKAWENHKYQLAEQMLEKVEPESKNYDSARVLLQRLPDTAAYYWVGQAEIDLGNQMFDAALQSCDKALYFRFDHQPAKRLREKILSQATDYWTAEADAKLDGENYDAAMEAIEKALDYVHNDPQALRLRKKIIKAQGKEEEQKEIDARERYATEFEGKLLDKGIEATVTTAGFKSDKLKVSYPGATKVDAHDFSQDRSLVNKLRKKGFKKLIISDEKGERWEIDI